MPESTKRAKMAFMTLKQRLFLRQYTRSLNATEAAYTVYNAKSRQSAAVMGSRLLRSVKVQQELNVIFEAKGLSLESIIKGLMDIANAKPEKITAKDVLAANLELIKLRRAT